MANRIKGCEGTLHLTDNGSNLQLVIDTQNMSITETAETETINVHGDCNAITVASSNSYEVSFDGLMSTDDLGQAEIRIGQTVSWTWFMTEGQLGTDPSYSGDFVINSIEKSFPSDSRVTFSISASGSGALVKSNVAW